MFTRDTPTCEINSIYCAELRFKRPVPGQRMIVHAKMVYANKERGETFGTCPLVYDSAVHGVEGYIEDGSQEGPRTLSKETLDALEKFLALAEKDLGRLVFERGHSVAPGETGRAETNEGLRVGLGGEG